jgi:tetratricopeptide (TPR) repeat protein
MKSKTATHQRGTGWLRLAWVIGMAAFANVQAAPSDLPPGPSLSETNAPDLLRSNLQLQEQLHRVQLSIEENREQANAAAVQSAQSIANRLETLEKTLAVERARDIDAVQDSTRMMWLVAGTFGIVGILAMLLMGYQWRTVSRLAAAGLSAGPLHAPGSGALAAFGNDDRRLLTNGSAERSNAQLLTAMEMLERRIKDLEQTSPHTGKSVGVTIDELPALPAAPKSELNNESSSDLTNRNRVTVLIGKGQSLLNLDQADHALTCFEEALALDPNHADAFLHKATALERLRKWPEALECYDRAIAANGSMIIAYLYKGGLFNRMERYGEALECYEQALRAQETR